MIDFKVDDRVHGQYSVTMKCTKCKTVVFSGQSNNRENIERIIRQKFAEVHINCEISSAAESSAV